MYILYIFLHHCGDNLFSPYTHLLSLVLPFKLMEIPHVKAAVCKITGNTNIWHILSFGRTTTKSKHQCLRPFLIKCIVLLIELLKILECFLVMKSFLTNEILFFPQNLKKEIHNFHHSLSVAL